MSDLTAAMDEVRALLPSGWGFEVFGDRKHHVAVARPAGRGRRRLAVTAEGDTAEAALHALAAKLRDRA